MRPTLLGRVVALAAIALLCIAFVVGSVAPAIAAVTLLAFRDAAGRSIQIGEMQAKRHVAPVVASGRPFTMEIEASNSSGMPMAIHDATGGMEPLATTLNRGRGSATLIQQLVADDPGRIRWDETTIETNDDWGMWMVEHRIPAEATTQVLPAGDLMEIGQRAGLRNVVQSIVRDPHAAARAEDVRMVRPWMPGDRAADTDWRMTTTTGTLHSRERERTGPRRIIVLLDATRSMRRPGPVPKIRSAVNVAVGVAGAAVGAGVSASLIAFHEEGVYTVTNATSRTSLRVLLQSLAGLPGVEGVEGFRLTTDLDRAVTKQEREFLRQASLLSSVTVPGTPSLDQALKALGDMSSGPATVVAIMDGEVNPRRVVVATDRMRQNGHHVIVVVPATGPHHCTKANAPIEDLREAMARRHRLAHTLGTIKTPMLSVKPGLEAEVVKEVSRFAV